MNKKQFLKIIKEDAKIVKKWPKWKQKYVISAEAAMTGEFLKVEEYLR